MPGGNGSTSRMNRCFPQLLTGTPTCFGRVHGWISLEKCQPIFFQAGGPSKPSSPQEPPKWLRLSTTCSFKTAKTEGTLNKKTNPDIWQGPGRLVLTPAELRTERLRCVCCQVPRYVLILTLACCLRSQCPAHADTRVHAPGRFST